MNIEDRKRFLLKLGWVLQRVQRKNASPFWRVTSTAFPDKQTDFASLREIDECLKRKLQSEMATRKALLEFEAVYGGCSSDEREVLTRWMATGNRDKVWHLTGQCIGTSWTVPALPRRWRRRAQELLSNRLDRPYQEFWSHAAERFLVAA